MAADSMAQLLAAAGNLSISELENSSRRLIEIRNSKTPLLRLPGELRNRIWRMALIEDIRYRHAAFEEDAESTTQEKRANGPTGCTKAALTIRKISDRRVLRGDSFSSILQDSVAHPEPTMVALPTFFNASRQMKTEIESILYHEIMVWEEYDHLFRTWKVLLPHQMGSLLDTRKLGMPILKLYKELRSDGSKTFVDIDFGTAQILGPNKYAPARRGGMVRFAAELELENLTWAIGKPYLVTEAAPAKTFIRHKHDPRDLWILQGH